MIFLSIVHSGWSRLILSCCFCNRKDAGEMLPKERVFNVPNTDGFIEEGRKVPKKTRPICIRGIDVDIPIDAYTAAGWPAVGGAAMKVSINR